MANTIIGRVFFIGPIEEIPSKNGGSPFLKRSLVLDCSRYDQYTGQKFENFPQVEFAGKNVTLLDNFNQDDLVEVSFALSGRSYIKDNVQKFFTSIIGYKVELYGPSTEQHTVHQVSQSIPIPQHQPQLQQSVDDALPF